MKRTIGIIIGILIGIVSLYVDYKNIPTNLGLHFSLDYWNIYIVVFLFGLGYYLIDKKAVDKENNKKDLLKYLIKDNYKRCLDMLKNLENNLETISKLFHYKLGKNPDIKIEELNIYKAVYKNEDLVNDLIKDGAGEKEIIEDYFYVQYKYNEITRKLAECNGNTEEVVKLIVELKDFLTEKEEQI